MSPNGEGPAEVDDPEVVLGEEIPTIFISYSHDSREHKAWVAELSTQLRAEGINVVLDQWDLRLGGDITLFMEGGIAAADRVLVIGTPIYKRKAEEGEGGVGFERLILTAELTADIETTKFIPIIREGDRTECIPIFLQTRLGVDFRGSADREESFSELVEDIRTPPDPVGPLAGEEAAPAEAEVAPPVRRAVELPELDEDLDPADAYVLASELAAQANLVAWRTLVERARQRGHDGLRHLRAESEGGVADDVAEAFVDQAVDHVAPLICIALAGVQSGQPSFHDQISVLDELLNIDGWSQGGRTRLIELPTTLGYVYQALHGAACVHTGQLSQAVELAASSVWSGRNHRYVEVWSHHGLMGWPHTLGAGCQAAWRYIASAHGRWPWLRAAFDTDTGYRRALVTYYLGLNVYELAVRLTTDSPFELPQDQILELAVPLDLAQEPDTLQRRAFEQLARARDVSVTWERAGASRADIEAHWDEWMSTCTGWVNRMYWGHGGGLLIHIGSPPHAALFRLVRPDL